MLRLFRLIDWLLRLPKELEAAFWQEMRAYEEERQMTYITSVERIGIAQGRREGLLIALTAALERMFGEAGRALAEELPQVQDDAVLERVADGLCTAATVDELRALSRPPDA